MATYPTAAVVKICLGASCAGPQAPVLEFEWTITDQIYWDLSNLDGGGRGKPGNVFLNQNVKVSPNRDMAGQYPQCVQLRYPMGTVCEGAYNDSPNDPGTHVRLPDLDVAALEMGVYGVDC
jgi:hypothetical protein